ncbi:GtrA family protein [Actinomadura scrupuli]|uniref:GtrA family protein n=1 Tax=Actinomadura scrupuli TaxID=559629 RepID=UPI003D958E58
MSVVDQAGTATAAPSYPGFVRELVTFGMVGTLGTLITFVGANLMRHWVGDGPLIGVVLPTMTATLVSYLLNRRWTFKDSCSDGSHREIAVFFALNGVGLVIQTLCMGFRTYSLHLDGALSYNIAMLAGTLLGAAFRYWSYRKWIFVPVSA